MVIQYNTAGLTNALVQTLPRNSGGGRPIEVHILDNRSRSEDLDAFREGVAGIPGVHLTSQP